MSAALISTSLVQAEISRVDDLRWDHRIVLVNTNSSSSPEILALQAEQAALAERDLVWFALDPKQGALVATNFTGAWEPDFAEATALRYDLEDPQRRYILIGKDGGEKDATAQLNFDRLYGLIDAMPMRQREMTRHKVQIQAH